MTPFAGSGQRAFQDEIGRIARGSGTRGAGDRDVVFGAEAAFEPGQALAEHPLDSLGLAIVDLTPKQIAEPRLGDEESNPLQRGMLGFDDGFAQTAVTVPRTADNATPMAVPRRPLRGASS